MKKLTGQSKVAAGFAVVAIILFAVLVASSIIDQRSSRNPAAEASVLRADSHRLSSPVDGKVTLVEFLDFECEACGAAYPFVEQLREKYSDRVTFVVRYFPLPGHRNAKNAAHAVEAAARQGEFEAMYERMFETQSEWGEAQDSKASLFRSYAADLGLNMERFNADVASASVASRVQKDLDDGLALGVSGTPTFYLNGERLQPQSTDAFIQAIDAALAE